MRDLRTLPKAELHVHLEGSIRASTLRELAAANGQRLPPALDGDRYVWRDFREFITQYVLVCSVLRCADDFRRVAYELCADAAAQGVRYLEATFTAGSHAARLGGDWDMPVESVLDGFEQARAETGIEARLCLDHVRGLDVDVCRSTLRAARRHHDRGVVSLGLGGDERHPPEPYADVFREAADAGLHSVPHAGEAAGPASIRGALHALGAERLGHGFRVLEDASLTDEVRDRRIALEVCPTSNVATGVVASLGAHPLPALLDAGLVVTLNSDDPAMFSSPLLGEYEATRTVFGLDDAAIAALARNAVTASFAPPPLKASLLREVDAWLQSDPGPDDKEPA